MAYTLNGLSVLEMDLSLPRNGAWAADLVVAVDNGAVAPSVGSPCVLVVDSSTFNGTVLVSDTRPAGRAVVRVIGGRGGLVDVASATNFGDGPTAGAVFTAIVSQAGELPGTALSSPQLLFASIPSWQTVADRTWGQNIGRLAQSLSATWRVDPLTAQVYLALDTFTSSASMPTNSVVEEVTYAGGATYQAPVLDALPLPGTTDPQGQPIEEVRIVLGGGRLTFQLLNATLASVLTPAIEVDFTRSYPCTVVAQNPDLTLQLRPDDQGVAGTGMQNVRVRGGASTSWTVRPGARCWAAFDDGDPSRPFVGGFMGADADPPGVPSLDNVAFGVAALAAFLSRSDVVDANLDVIKAAASAAITAAVPGDGGKAAFQAFLSALVFAPTACRRVKSD